MSDAMLWSATRPDRAELADCAICGVTAGIACGERLTHTGRCWEVGLTWPGSRLGERDPVLSIAGCQATVEERYVPADDWDWQLLYRGACLGCGWASERTHDDSNEALADSLDHALPGWRRVPVVERFAHDASQRQRTVWLEQVGGLYTAHGFDTTLAPGNGGVIRTLRQRHGTRSHYTGQFFDVCAGLTAAPVPVAVPEQIALF